jgi:hypothetical protein
MCKTLLYKSFTFTHSFFLQLDLHCPFCIYSFIHLHLERENLIVSTYTYIIPCKVLGGVSVYIIYPSWQYAFAIHINCGCIPKFNVFFAMGHFDWPIVQKVLKTHPATHKYDLHIFTLILHDYVKQCKCISFTLTPIYTCT